MASSPTKTTPSRTARRAAAPAEQASPVEQAVRRPAPMPVMRLAPMDPRSLLIEGNIRSDAALDAEFLNSIREQGVLVPIVAVQTEQGLQVRYGQRRTLAAICTSR